ncbi:MAG: AAA family ATPase [Nitrososphaerota archaeon]|nr:AAA family ATPase [Nitrososphaerota archaeon]
MLEIARPSTITLVKGAPGAGKTTLVLKSLIDVEKSYFVSYNETIDSLLQKMERLGIKNNGHIELVRGLSGTGGALNKQTSEIISQMQKGAAVVIDSIDAMLEGVKSDFGMRTLLQVIYSSAKQHNASLILITEGSMALTERLSYISDIIINVELEIKEEKIIRYAEIEKDRDRMIAKQRYNFTFEQGASIFDGSIGAINDIAGYEPVRFPDEIKIGDNNEYLGRILFILDHRTPAIFSYYMRMLIVSHFINRGFQVLLYLRPDEDNMSVMKDIKKLTGLENPEIFVFKTSEEAENRKAIEQYESILSNKKTLHIYDALSNEALYMRDPVQYEDVVRVFTSAQSRQKATVIGFGYNWLKTLDVQKKYASIIYVTYVYDNDVFLRGIRPSTPAYHVKIDGEMKKLSMKFTRIT